MPKLLPDVPSHTKDGKLSVLIMTPFGREIPSDVLFPVSDRYRSAHGSLAQYIPLRCGSTESVCLRWECAAAIGYVSCLTVTLTFA